MEKEIKITIKNGLYEVTLANVNGKEMMNCFRRQKRQPKLYQAILMKI